MTGQRAYHVRYGFYSMHVGNHPMQVLGDILVWYSFTDGGASEHPDAEAPSQDMCQVL
jgi:hypothetical protein